MELLENKMIIDNSYGLFVHRLVELRRTSYRRYRKRVRESISILKRQSLTRTKSLAIVDKAVIIVDSPKYSGIHQFCRAEPPTFGMNVGDTAA